MRRALSFLVLLLSLNTLRAEPPFKPIVTGLSHPESVTIGPDGRVYVSVIGEFDKDGDGAVLVIEKGGKAVPFAKGLDDPKGLAIHGNWVYVADKTKVLRINPAGKVEVLVAADAFPTPPIFLNDIVVDPESGTLFVSDSGTREGKGGAIYRVPPKGKTTVVADQKRWPELRRPNGLAMDGQNHLLVCDCGNGVLYRLRLADGIAEKVADGLGHADGVCWDKFGRFYVADWDHGKVFGFAQSNAAPVLLAEGFQHPADLCLDPTGKFLLVPDMGAGTVTAVPARIPNAEIDEKPFALETTLAFPDLQWTGWKGENDRGQPVPLRPVVLTHAGDGSQRNFVVIQQGTIHVFPNDPKLATKTKVFLDIQDRVVYDDKQNEEGTLGLAFHPDYKSKGEFFVFYTTKKAKMTNVLSRFRVSKDDPDRADPGSEEVLLEIQRPFWNHDGGTICFGPDGYLYIALGDGGAANDPFNNAQNLSKILGKVLRIDVNRKDEGKNYAVPADNPFVGKANVRPEIWAYGLRNIWRMAFDPKTGNLWAGEVGQNLYEEINIIRKGGNYGWKLRESFHPFGPTGVSARPDLVEPIWEYHHDIGKSITGGMVYRGKQFPELQGSYLYADYVTGKIWGLRYDEAAGRVVANKPIRDKAIPIMSFGEDERGEAYMMTYSPLGRGLYQFKRVE